MERGREAEIEFLFIPLLLVLSLSLTLSKRLSLAVSVSQSSVHPFPVVNCNPHSLGHYAPPAVFLLTDVRLPGYLGASV